MKAILVIDMPDKCLNCPLMDDNMYCKGFKPKGFITKMCVEDYVMHGTRHPSCPLKPMPMRVASEHKWYAQDKVYMVSHDITEWDKGWNDCVEMLEGEEE